MEPIIGRCSKHPSQNFVNCPMCRQEEIINKEQIVINGLKKKGLIKDDHPGDKYQRLFNAISDIKGIALHGEMNEIIHIVRQDFDEWTKIENKEDYPPHNRAVLVFIPEEDNHITAGMWDIEDVWVLLDEYREPKSKVTHWMPMPKEPK